MRLLCARPRKTYLAGLHIFWLPKVTNANDPIPDCFAGYRALQHSLKWVFSQGAQNQRIVRTCRLLRRPIHELSKMENKSCLDPVFFGGCLRPGSFPSPCQQQKRKASKPADEVARDSPATRDRCAQGYARHDPDDVMRIQNRHVSLA